MLLLEASFQIRVQIRSGGAPARMTQMIQIKLTLYSFSFQRCIHEETRIWLLERLDDRKTSNANVNMLGFKIKFESLSSTYCVLPIRTKVSEEILLWYMTCMPYRSESEL